MDWHSAFWSLTATQSVLILLAIHGHLYIEDGGHVHIRAILTKIHTNLHSKCTTLVVPDT